MLIPRSPTSLKCESTQKNDKDTNSEEDNANVCMNDHVFPPKSQDHVDVDDDGNGRR